MIDKLNRAHYSLWCSNYWLTNRVRMIGAAVCGLVGGFLVASVRFEGLFFYLSGAFFLSGSCLICFVVSFFFSVFGRFALLLLAWLLLVFALVF